MRYRFFLVLLSLNLVAVEAPWLTGSLIAPEGTAVPFGDFLIQSVLFAGSRQSIFANKKIHSLSYQGNYYFGLTSFCDFNAIVNVIDSAASHQHSVGFGDLTLGLDFQLLSADRTRYFPGIKFAIREVFPTGKFQYLYPRKWGADQMGMGTFATQFDLVFYKLVHLQKQHWLSYTVSAQYTVSTPVQVHGFNAYGGGFGTRGTVLPGAVFQGIASFELTLTRNWAIALDNVYTNFQANQFFGISGITFDGTVAQVGAPNGYQWSFCPAMEWNFNEHFGIIAGYYFSAASKNCADFQYGAVNFNYYY